MKRILVRSGKNPADVVSAAKTLESNLIGDNSGNLIFAAAAHKLLSADGVEVVSTQNRINPDDAAKIDSEYDAFVVPLANAFRPSFESGLQRLTALIEKLSIPVIMLSGGAQLDIDGGFDDLRSIEPTVKAFCKAVLDKSSRITVRGEYTQKYLKSLGFSQVDVIGCPSLTTQGPGLQVNRRVDQLTTSSKIAYSVQSSNPTYAELIDNNLQMYDGMTYIAQDKGSFEMMLWSREMFGPNRDRRLPFNLDHPAYKDGAARFYVDASTWINEMKSFEMAFGPRVHGSISAILAGTPAVLIAHDSRTLELANYHCIPYILETDLVGDLDVQEIFDRADYSQFNVGQMDRFNKVVSFLHENGFRTIFDEGQESQLAAYERSLDALDFAAAVSPLSAGLSASERYRVGWLRQRVVLSERRLNALEKSITELQSNLA